MDKQYRGATAKDMRGPVPVGAQFLVDTGEWIDSFGGKWCPRLPYRIPIEPVCKSTYRPMETKAKYKRKSAIKRRLLDYAR